MGRDYICDGKQLVNFAKNLNSIDIQFIARNVHDSKLNMQYRTVSTKK